MVDVRLMQGDCLERMDAIEAGSVDMILADPPYGVTRLAWDSVIPLEPLWKQYKRVIKKGGAIVLFGSQPFTSVLIMSNLEWFKYCWYWEKPRGANFSSASYQPLKVVEEAVVFSDGASTYAANGASMVYHPPKVKLEKPRVRTENATRLRMFSAPKGDGVKVRSYDYDTPRNLLYVSGDDERGFHPTQKPVKLLEFLILTYTQAGETVLDSCAGSGSTGVACLNTGRNFIGIEKDEHYFSVAKRRLEQPYTLPMLT